MLKKILGCAAVTAIMASGAGAHDMLHSAHEGHAHGDSCGHAALEHGGHVDYLHDGHLHNAHDSHVDEHTLPVSSVNPDAEELAQTVSGENHMHGHDGEEHMMVQHGAHYDYIHEGRLHFVHDDHTDDHGPVKIVASS